MMKINSKPDKKQFKIKSRLDEDLITSNSQPDEKRFKIKSRLDEDLVMT